MKHELEGLKGGEARTWENFYETLWVIATVRYATQQQLKAAFPDATWRKKCATPKVLKALTERGYLNLTGQGVFAVTAKAVKLLKECSEYNTEIIKLAQGEGAGDSLRKSEVFLKLLKLPDFYALFFDEFRHSPKDDQPFLVPDGVLVRRRDNRAKLAFVEVEQPKPNWEEHLLGKKKNYEVLARDKNLYEVWWRKWSARLGLRLCPIDDFGFEVVCYAKSFPLLGYEGWKKVFIDQAQSGFIFYGLFFRICCSIAWPS